MLSVRINNSTKDDWYYKYQYKNNKAKTFDVIPNASCTKFIVMSGENMGREIDPAHVKDIPASELIHIFKTML